MGYEEKGYIITCDSCQCYKHLTKENTIELERVELFNNDTLYNKYICNRCYEELTLKQIITNIKESE
jgi:uncharacterized pyridoxamine 5'-phosphate oxidase family protein